ncbi:MAG: hypothetical protein SFX18_05680 [Pirellulales bacterium]|nr:hypothetical protein [Pirellulales bacterium]
MSQDIRYQPKCYFASDDYAESFWGKYIYIYQGKGSLRLTDRSLCLEGCPEELEIPFQDIKWISSTNFSLWTKPFGLSRLTICYRSASESKIVHLIPHNSPFDPTWVTSELVQSWLQTLSQVEQLSDRVEYSQPASETTSAGVGQGW